MPSRSILARPAPRLPLRRCSLAAVLALAAAGPALADQGQITWTTYLYQGPDTHYSVIGEMPQATTVELVGACANGWCEIQSEGRRGFVMAEVVAKGDPTHPGPGVLAQPAASIVLQPAGPCFDVNQKGGNGGNAMTTVCAK